MKKINDERMVVAAVTVFGETDRFADTISMVFGGHVGTYQLGREIAGNSIDGDLDRFADGDAVGDDQFSALNDGGGINALPGKNGIFNPLVYWPFGSSGDGTDGHRLAVVHGILGICFGDAALRCFWIMVFVRGHTKCG